MQPLVSINIATYNSEETLNLRSPAMNDGATKV